ncbi:MAG: lysophospholipid acyltransferase family protein [Candidatus Gastranaerophilaceae bacterium]|nr:lysophospholipid acyltransferase family protein [Candidatus Gastranaerophilaceae bacterium]
MIRFIRGITVILLFALFGFGALFIRYCIFPLQKTKLENYETLQKSWQFFVWLLKALKIIELKIKDEEKICSIKNSIIVSTHPSFIDIVILMSIIPHSTCFVAEKLARNPFFKGMVNLLFILEVNSIDEWLGDACKKLDNGLNVIIFPMGRRHRKNEFPKIRRGTALISQKSRKNITLLNIETSSDFLQINQPIYEAGDKPVLFTLEYIGQIDTNYYLGKFQDEVTYKSEITKQISAILYKR